MKRFAFYGTLRKGHGNRDWCDEHVTSVKEVVLGGYKMRNLGWYPLVVKTGNEEDNIVVELVTITDPDTIASITNMELVAGYIIETVKVSGHEWIIFLFEQDIEEYPEVICGDWTLHTEKNEKSEAY